MNRTRHTRAFTLIELLVVISIIAILMSILLPAIRKTFTIAGQGMCAKNIQGINQAFHAYGNEFMEKIPLTTGTANLSNWFAVDVYRKFPIGNGCLWEADLINDHEMLFCPGVDDNNQEGEQYHFRGWIQSRDHFPEMMQNINVNSPVTGYSIGYCSAPGSIVGSGGYNMYPEKIVSPNDTLENLREVFVVWTADVRADIGEPRSTQYTVHNRYKFINFGNVDGSTRSITDPYDREPTQQDYAAADYHPSDLGPVGGYDMWWFRNDRSPMGFWHWFGPGHGF